MEVMDPYEYLDTAVQNRQLFEQVISYITEHSVNDENLGNTLMSYYMDKMASMYYKVADEIYESEVGAKVLIHDIILPSMITDFSLDKDAILIVLINLTQNERKYAEEHHVDRATSKYNKIYAVIYDELIKRIIAELDSYINIYDLREHFIDILSMRATYFDKFLNKCFLYLYDKPDKSAEDLSAFEKMLQYYEEKVVNAIKVRRHATEVLDFTEPKHINFIVSSAFRTLGRRLLEVFEDVYASNDSASALVAAIAQFQISYGPFTKGQLRIIMQAASPIYSHYISGARIEAGKTLITPNGNINISNLPRNRPDSVFAAYALREMLPNYNARQRQSQIYGPVSAQLIAANAMNALPEGIDYRTLVNNEAITAANRIQSISSPYYESHPSYTHKTGYEIPENIGNYVRSESIPNKSAIKSKPANKSRKLRFNNAEPKFIIVERYQGGNYRRLKHNNRRPTRRNRRK